MPRSNQKPCAECGHLGTVARQLCSKCYSRARNKGFKNLGRPTAVIADLAWPDTHPEAPGGQKLCLYTCNCCGKQHLVSWHPFDTDPGLKVATCRNSTAAGVSPGATIYVLAPSEENILDSPPPEFRPAKRIYSREGAEGSISVGGARAGDSTDGPLVGNEDLEDEEVSVA